MYCLFDLLFIAIICQSVNDSLKFAFINFSLFNLQFIILYLYCI